MRKACRQLYRYWRADLTSSGHIQGRVLPEADQGLLPPDGLPYGFWRPL